MKPRFFAIACPLALGLASLAAPAIGEDLLQIYREALRSDPAIAAAQANWEATQERAPQARAGLLPNVTATASGERQQLRPERSEPIRRLDVNRNFRPVQRDRVGVAAAVPLPEPGPVRPGEAAGRRRPTTPGLRAAGPDRPRRGRVFRRAARRSSTSSSPRARRRRSSEQLAQAKRNFEVGVATITDTNEAQAKYDPIVAQEITARNDYDNRRDRAARDHRPLSAGT